MRRFSVVFVCLVAALAAAGAPARASSDNATGLTQTLGGAAAVAAAGLVTAGIVTHPELRPEWHIRFGRTFAVGSPLQDAYDQGGFDVSAAALWPWEDRFRFGVQAFASDFGSQVRPVTLADPSGGPAKNYGSIDFGHRGAWGAAWRADAMGPRFDHLGRGYLTASYGYFRYKQDRVGKETGALSGVGGSLGAGLERTLTPHHALGVTASATWMSDKFTRRYGSAALEWKWRW